MFDTTAITTTTGSLADTAQYSETTAKQTTRGIRVWLENKQKLEAAGFKAGTLYDIAPVPNGIMLVAFDGEPVEGLKQGRVSSCRRGDSVRPIIDLHSKALAAVFNAGDAVQVRYTTNCILITKQEA